MGFGPSVAFVLIALVFLIIAFISNELILHSSLPRSFVFISLVSILVSLLLFLNALFNKKKSEIGAGLEKAKSAGIANPLTGAVLGIVLTWAVFSFIQSVLNEFRLNQDLYNTARTWVGLPAAFISAYFLSKLFSKPEDRGQIKYVIL